MRGQPVEAIKDFKVLSCKQTFRQNLTIGHPESMSLVKVLKDYYR